MPAPGASRPGSWTVGPTLLLSPVFQLHPKSSPGQLSVQQAQPLQCKCLGVSEAGSEIHEDLEMGRRPASGLAGERPPACSIRRQFMGHGQWRRPSAPLHFIKKKEGRKTNKQRLHGDHTHGTGQQGQAVPSWHAPMMSATDPHRWPEEELGPIGPAGLSPGLQPRCPPAALGLRLGPGVL